MADTAKSTGYQATWNENQALFDELTNYTGMPINLTNIWYLQDVLFQEVRKYNLFCNTNVVKKFKLFIFCSHMQILPLRTGTHLS